MSQFLIAFFSVFEEALIREHLDLSVGNFRYLFFFGRGILLHGHFTFEKETTKLSLNFGHQLLSDAVPHHR
jgi:hypothetical protein